MSKGRKANQAIKNDWESIFWKNIPSYINILNLYFKKLNYEFISVDKCIDKLSFKLPKGLKSKEILTSGKYPVISQSKEYIIGYSDKKELLIDRDLPFIIFGDHSKTIKYIDKPFIIGADGVKIIKPIKTIKTKYFYYFLFGIITETKDYGRHYKYLKQGFIPKIDDTNLQHKIVLFLEDFLNNNIFKEKKYFNSEIEKQIILMHQNQVDGTNLSTHLTHQLDLVKKLRQSFLREAMQGKLTADWRTQYPDVEPATQLLAKIKAEKEQLIKEKRLKRGKASSQSVSLIEEIEVPYSWIWAKTDEIFFVTKLAGFEYSKHISLKQSGEIPVIRAQNVRPFEIKRTNILYIDRKTSELLERCALTKEALLVTFIGAGIGDVARFSEKERWHLAPNVAKLEPFDGCENMMNLKFINYFLMSDNGRTEIFKHVKATAQPSLSMGTIRDIDIPLPPLSEQKAIVKKLDKLMAYCDGLEESIKNSQSQNEMLLGQVLREALEPKEKEVVV